MIEIGLELLESGQLFFLAFGWLKNGMDWIRRKPGNILLAKISFFLLLSLVL